MQRISVICLLQLRPLAAPSWPVHPDRLPSATLPLPPGATLQIVNGSGASVATIASDATGNYSFAELASGNYTVNISGTANGVHYSSTDSLDVTGNATGVNLNAYPV